MPAGPTRDREIVVEIALAVGDRHDGAVVGQGGEAGGLGVEPALRFLVGRIFVPAILAFAAFVGGAHPDVLVEQSQGQAVGGHRQGGVNEEAEMLGVSQLTQAAVARRAGEVGVGGVLSDQEDAGVAGGPIDRRTVVGVVDVVGIDVGVVEKTVGGVGSRRVAGGGGDAVAGVFEGGPDDEPGALVEAFVSQMERIEVA